MKCLIPSCNRGAIHQDIWCEDHLRKVQGAPNWHMWPSFEVEYEEPRKRSRWHILWSVATVIGVLALFFWMAVAQAQTMHCGNDHPGGPWMEWGQRGDRYTLALHSTDPEHRFIGGFQFIFEPSYRDIRLSAELSSMPTLELVTRDLGGYTLVFAFFTGLLGNAWASGTPALSFAETCQSRYPWCIPGPTVGMVPWWIRTADAPGSWYPGWRDHVGADQSVPPIWGTTPLAVERSTWSAAKILYR